MDSRLRVMSLKETNKYANVIARAARNEAAEAIRKAHKTGLLRSTRKDEIANFSSILVTLHLRGNDEDDCPTDFPTEPIQAEHTQTSH